MREELQVVMGKSSLLNSLLDCPNLTSTHNGGKACTCVATEYHYRQGDDCVIKVERYSLDEIRKQVKDLLLSYRHFHLHGNDPDARVVEELLDEEDRRAPENRARLAIDTFKAMFCRRMRDEAFLLANPEEEVLGTMYQWLEEAEELLTDEENITAALGECAGILSRLTSEAPSADGPAVWPFIKKIKLFVDAHILSKGLILVDLPGLSDVNSARRDITERYILRCDEIFIVCMMGRAVTDRSVEGIFDLAQHKDKSNIGIICTNSDHFKPEEERDNCRDVQMRIMIEHKIGACIRDREIIQSIDEYLDAEDNSNAEITAEKRNAQTSFFMQKRKAERQLEQHEFNLKKYLMEVRAQRISDELREKYGDRTSSRNLAVFFVSNTMYWDNRQKLRDRAVPWLELSGILAVRRHCMGMVSESQFALASKFLRDEVGALLSDVELWVRSGAESTTAERRRLVREVLEVVERQMTSSLLRRTSELNTISKDFDKEFDDNLYGPGRGQVDAWGAAAAGECWQWEGWLHRTSSQYTYAQFCRETAIDTLYLESYTAFCSKFGQHKTKTVGAHCWNEKIMKAMNASMEPSWSALSRSSETRMESITSIVTRFMNWAVEYLEAELHHSQDSFEILAEGLTSRERLLVTAIEKVWNDFDNNLRLLRGKATKPTRTSFIGQGMEDAYQAASHESGDHPDARRKYRITNTASSPHLFLTILQNSRTEFHDLTSTLQRQVRETVAVHAASVVETLNIVRGENAAREADGDPAFRARIEGEARRVKEAMDGLITAAGV
ncbi:hypothetical protein F5Y19DRAFT_482375 [Xylariaceae sp. FL1651]|nr:hypothetical protein F5Y19DRAFT_482375 [Xylariaceae sp. FL1651]